MSECDLFEDALGCRGPDEGFGFVVVGGEVVLDRGDEVRYGVEYSAPQGLIGQLAEPTLDQVLLAAMPNCP